MAIPEKGMGKQEVLDALESFRENDVDWRSGKIFAYTFTAGPELEEVVKAAYMKYLTENALDPTSFPSVAKIEKDVVRFVIDLLRGDANAVGNFTSGGSESIMLAVKTARDMARVEKPHITAPEMVIPRTAHSAFHKAAQYFGLKLILTDFDADYRASVESMRAAITENTILIAASAPSYAQGVVDPIREIGALALERGLLFHVDACMGGIMMSFMRNMGFDIPDFDFTVPGVTSISADMHKYGYAAKGASVISYRNKEIRKHQIFATTASTSYAMFNATILSSKSGGPMAGAWATIHYLGREGYERIIRDVMGATRKMIDGINAIDGLRVLGKPDMCIFSFASDAVNVFQLADYMTKKGWYLQPQFSTEKTPHNLHITLMHGNVARTDEFLADLAECVAELKVAKSKIDINMVREQVKNMLASFGDKAVEQLSAMAGIDNSGKNIEELAMISCILDSLPKDISKALLVEFVNNLFV